MSFSDRTYPDIVRDLLTLLTGGTVAEQHTVGLALDPIPLANAPVRRVSSVDGQVQVGTQQIPYRFTERDFELLPGDGSGGLSLRFRDGGKRPAPGSTIVVNYYPTRLPPTPLNDVNVGSVVRTLLETVAFELAAQYQQLQKVYDSAFVDTAQGQSLDRVVALVAVERLKQGHPVGKVRFSRRAGSPGDIFLPVNTAVIDGKGSRYLTSQEAQIPSGQPSMEIWVQGELPATKVVAAGALSVLERAIAGIDRVSNDQATYPLTAEEQDPQLAARAKNALHGSGKGTLDSIRFAVQGMPFVSSVSLTEMPDGVPGTLRVDVALTDDSPDRRAEVKAEVEAYRPAGVAVDVVFAGPIQLSIVLALTLKGASLSAADLADVKDGATTRLVALAREVAAGGALRKTRLIAAVLADARAADAVITLTADGAPVTGDKLAVPSGKTLKLGAADVRFDQVSFEDSPTTGPRVIEVSVQLTVVVLQANLTDLGPLGAPAKARLGPFLAGFSAGQKIDFDQVLAAVQDDAVLAVPPSSSVTFRDDSGAFQELRQGDAPYTVPTGASLAAGPVTLAKESS